MYFSTMRDWLAWIGTLHPTDIELGLDRVKEVAKKLDLLTPHCPVIIVGGSNGKGSTVAGLTSIYRAAGYHVGAFTSPFLFTYNEQVRIDGVQASDADFCAAFEQIESARGNITLTTFEYGTLAALLIFKKHIIDIMILEVGLGGRLDAVNIIDADVAIITTIALDHMEWLGPTREDIAREKAGIFRVNKPAICGDEDPPVTLLEAADKLHTPLYCQGTHFQYQENIIDWTWQHQTVIYDHLPLTTLALQNMSSVLMAITLLQDRLPVTRAAVIQGLTLVELIGRVQIFSGPVMEVFDVSHNPASVLYLAKQLKKIPCVGKTHAVFSMLADKDLLESINAIKDVIDTWYVAPLNAKRTATMERLQNAFDEVDVKQMTLFTSIEEAYEVATMKADIGDRIVVFGSFHTVADVLNCKQT